ncbi:MAG: TIGR03936 family radical SAM-associated protein, partial [Oscillospiraceae bacterium]
MNTVRINFHKTGVACYFSHLDLQRVMTRALKKSGLPVWYSLGYNPRIYLTFALPLTLGHESICESFDFRLNEELDEAKIYYKKGAENGNIHCHYRLGCVYDEQENYEEAKKHY